MSKAYFAGPYDLHRDLDMKFIDHLRYVLATTLAEQQKTKRIRHARTDSLEVPETNAAVVIPDGKYCR